MQSFGQRIAFYRKNLDLTQEQLAAVINSEDSESPDFVCTITKERLGNIERGRYEPTLSEILAFSDVLGVSTDCLIHNLCHKTKCVVMHDFTEICDSMCETKRDKFLELVVLQAEFVKNNIHCV